MRRADEKASFLENGYLHVREALNTDEVQTLRAEFDKVWETEGARVDQHKLLKYAPFIHLIEHPAILNRVQAIFGNQTQLLQYDLLRQGPRSTADERRWHRDFSFPGDRPLTINSILYFDEMDDERGPTRVLPGSHRGEALPPAERKHQPLDGEVAVYAKPGDVVFINGAVWHSGSRNRSDGLRRNAYLYYGYWWLKRYEADRELPWQAFEGASEQRLRLLGVKMPDRDVHMYAP